MARLSIQSLRGAEREKGRQIASGAKARAGWRSTVGSVRGPQFISCNGRSVGEGVAASDGTIDQARGGRYAAQVPADRRGAGRQAYAYTVCRYQLYSRSEMECSNSSSSCSLQATKMSMYFGSMYSAITELSSR